MNNIPPPEHSLKTPDLSIELYCRGLDEYAKLSYPVKHGIFSRMETPEFIFEFNLNHEIRHARSKGKDWFHPSEWLKRTMGNDWVYYSTGGYSGVFEALGEYYLPNLMYPTNSLLGGTPFKETGIDHIVNNWHTLVTGIPETGLPEPFLQWLLSVKQVTPEQLEKKAQALFDISGSRVTVMPPDARHVDYNIIPLTIADGCLYKCRFCKIKNKKKFSPRSEQDVLDQIKRLRQAYHKDIINFNGLFLGEHDALNAPGDLVLMAVKAAYDFFEFDTAYMKKNHLFLFGSVDSLLSKDMAFFTALNRLPFETFINIGLESYDQATLDFLGKPLSREKVGRAFKKIQDINNRYPHIELTCNFVMDNTLPASHYESILSLVRDSVNRKIPKGCVYMSPLAFGRPSRENLYDFYKFKAQSRFPTFLYLIQRL